jgi:hypothetical protein
MAKVIASCVSGKPDHTFVIESPKVHGHCIVKGCGLPVRYSPAPPDAMPRYESEPPLNVDEKAMAYGEKMQKEVMPLVYAQEVAQAPGAQGVQAFGIDGPGADELPPGSA